MMAVLSVPLHLALLLLLAPILPGLTSGHHPGQPLRDLRRLIRKPALWPEHAGWFGAAPVTVLAASLLAALLVPSFTLEMATAPLAELVLLIFLFGLAEAAIALAGFDAQSGPAALSAQRLLVSRVPALAGLLILVLAVTSATGSSNLHTASAALREAGPNWAAALPCLAATILFLSADPGATATLETPFAGRDLAVLRFAAQLRFVTLLSLLAALLLPFGLGREGAGLDTWVVGAALWAVKITVLAAAAAAIGRWRTRLRADQAPELAVLGLLLALIGAALFLAGQRAA